MTKTPTYTANEIRKMCCSFELEYETFKTIVDIVDEEIDLYSDEDLVFIMQASVIMFSRSMLKLPLKNLK